MLSFYLKAVLVAVLIAASLRLFVIGSYRVTTHAMSPALLQGDFIFSNKWAYGIRWPWGERWLRGPSVPGVGDLIVFRCPGQRESLCLKRVVAIAGDRVAIKENLLTVNNEPLLSEELPLPADLFPGVDDYSAARETNRGRSYTVLFRRGRPLSPVEPSLVPADQVFVLGDARDASEDSRDWGTVPVTDIDSRAGTIWLSLDWQQRGFGGLPRVRWERMFTRAQ
jgi:signal peptidase I